MPNTRVPGVRQLVILEILTATAAGAAIGLNAPWWAVALAAMTTIALGIAGTPIARTLRARSAFLLRGRLPDTPMTGPTVEVATPDGPIGTRWNGTTVATVIAIDASGPSIAAISPHGRPGDRYGGAQRPLPLDLIADSLRQPDIRLASIDVISHARRLHPHSPLAKVYHRIVGPLPVAAHRATYLLLRLDPHDNPAAVARRGGGTAGTHRAATLATRRLVHRLRDSGYRARPLNAADVDRAELDLLDGQHPRKLSEDLGSMASGVRRTATYSIAPEAIPEILATCWAVPADTTSLTLTLAPASGERITISGLLRHTATGDLPDAGPGAHRLFGRQRHALAASLPGGPDPVDLPPGRIVSRSDLGVLSLAPGGCGQLLGAHPTGAAVFAPIFGPAVATVSVTADISLIRQIVVRAIAIGARIVVHTDRPDRWLPLAASIGDSQWLRITTAEPARSPFDLVVLDGIRPGSTGSGTTAFAPTVLTVTTSDGPAADLRITQNSGTAQDFVVTANGHSVPVTMVTTGDERAWFVGPDDAADELVLAAERA
ncbi:type VII secretion protein EccE [Jongsikchunia kroppenstedtii]|uniref:type VII secretion protein EccE n=1 Tax=Jongsikchunia kroppenstedtii TaxID=1121721 RepID=UPI00138ACAE1|nr:type VII secretion protein EccE [Jongsikchunia kroppenstedtii]